MPYIPIVLVVALPITVTVWITRTARKLSHKRNELILADKQLAIYSQRHKRARAGPEAQLATEQVELSRAIYQTVAAEYNCCISKITNRPIAWLLGYRSAGEVKDE